MKKLTGVTAILAAAALFATACGQSDTTDSGSGAAEAGGSYSIGISQYVSHPSLDASIEGFKEAFADAGVDVSFDEQNAQADQSTVTSIATKFKAANHDLVLAVATPSAQASAQVLTDIPVLFTSVTDPVEAGLVDSLETPGANVTGTSDMNPVAEQIELITKIAPDAKRVGVVYSSGEVNSQVQVEIAREAASEHGLEIVEKTISASAEVQQALQALGDVDAIYVPTDNNVVSGIGSVVQFAEEQQIPVISAETSSVSEGCLATVGIDYHELGYQTGEMALRILQDGEDPASMPVETHANPRLVVNTEAAERMNVTLSDELLAEVDEQI